MKSFSITVLLILSLFVIPASIFAQKPSENPGKPETVQGRLEERKLLKKEGLSERIGEKRASKAANLTNKRKERIMHFWEKLFRRLEKHIERLETLIERIESRLAKIKEENPKNIDIESVEEELDRAKRLLEEAKTDLAAANASLEEVLSSDDPKAAFGLIRETVKNIKTKLVEVHRTLVHLIGNIKGLRVGTTKKLSPTITTVPKATSTPIVVPTLSE